MDQTPPPTWHRRLLGASVLVMFVAANLSIAVSQVALGVALVCYLLGLRDAGFRPNGLEWPSLALFAWALLMVPFSTLPELSLVYLRRFYLFAALWVTAAVAVDETMRRRLFLALMTGAVALTVWSVGLAIQRTGSVFGFRMGLVSNSMTTGGLLMMVVLVAGAVAATGALGRRTRLAAALAGGVVFVALLQTLTRSAWLGLLVGAWVMVVVVRPRRALVVGLGAAAVLVLLAVAPAGMLPGRLAERLDPQEFLHGKSTVRRLDMWRGGWAMIKACPLTGVGDRGLTEIGPEYYGDEDTLYHGHMHSNPVQFAVIWGIPGFLLAMGLITWQGVVLWRNLRRLEAEPGRGPPWARAWLLGGLGVWAGFFVAGLTEWYFGDAEPFLLYMAILGAALGWRAPADGRAATP